jgi:hypothetical protein
LGERTGSPGSASSVHVQMILISAYPTVLSTLNSQVIPASQSPRCWIIANRSRQPNALGNLTRAHRFMTFHRVTADKWTRTKHGRIDNSRCARSGNIAFISSILSMRTTSRYFGDKSFYWNGNTPA